MQIPSYEELKQLDSNYARSYWVIHLYGSARFEVNLFDEGYTISLDYLEGKYLANPFYIPEEFEYIKLNTLYKLNKKNYNLVLKQLKYIKKRILEEVKEQLE